MGCPEPGKLFPDAKTPLYAVVFIVAAIITTLEVRAFKRMILAYSQVDNSRNIPFQILGRPVKCSFWYTIMLILSFCAKWDLFLNGIFLSKVLNAHDERCDAWRNVSAVWKNTLDDSMLQGFPVYELHRVFFLVCLLTFLQLFNLVRSDAPWWGEPRQYVWEGEQHGYAKVWGHLWDWWTLSEWRKRWYNCFPFWEPEKKSKAFFVVRSINAGIDFNTIQQFREELLADLARTTGAGQGLELTINPVQPVELVFKFHCQYGEYFSKAAGQICCRSMQNILGTQRCEVERSVEKSVWHADVFRVKAFTNRMLLVSAGNLEWTITRARQKLREGTEERIEESFGMIEKECERCCTKIWLFTVLEKWLMLECETNFFAISCTLGHGSADHQMLFTVVVSFVFYIYGLGCNFQDLRKLKGLQNQMQIHDNINQKVADHAFAARGQIRWGGWGFVFACLGAVHSLVELAAAGACSNSMWNFHMVSPLPSANHSRWGCVKLPDQTMRRWEA